jgi:hypothetical protein
MRHFIGALAILIVLNACSENEARYHVTLQEMKPLILCLRDPPIP